MPGRQKKKKARACATTDSTDSVDKVVRDAGRASGLRTASRTVGTCISGASRDDVVAKSSTSEDATTGTGAESNFERELDWCIRQLEHGLLRTEATKAQKEQSRKYIKTLQSPKSPLPKRRQLMRQLFGDYRAKMKSDPLPQEFRRGTINPGIAVTDKQKLLSSGKFYKPCVKCAPDVGVAPMSSDKSPFLFMFNVDDTS